MTALTATSKIHFGRGRTGHRELKEHEAPESAPGRLPRVTKLMALAIRFEQLVRDGVVADYAELARLGHVTRARMSQVTSFLNLAPDIQEGFLFLPRVESGPDPVTERDLRPIMAEPDWRRQRRKWDGT